MKKTLSILLLSLALFTFNGCGEDDDTLDDGTEQQGDGNFDPNDGDFGQEDGLGLDLLNLQEGYFIRGTDNVSISFCRNTYEFNRGSTQFLGTFSILKGGTQISFKDANGGGYALDATAGSLELNEAYDIRGGGATLVVAEIIPENSCN